MAAVDADGDWDLVFPDTSDPAYAVGWTGDLDAWIADGGKVEVHKTVKARAIWDLIVDAAWSSAEPGLFFVDRYAKMSNSYYYAKIWCTNPCGEQGIPADAVCNLAHLALNNFLNGHGLGRERAEVDWEGLRKAIHAAVRFMDNVIDIAYTPHPDHDRQQKSGASISAELRASADGRGQGCGVYAMSMTLSMNRTAA